MTTDQIRCVVVNFRDRRRQHVVLMPGGLENKQGSSYLQSDTLNRPAGFGDVRRLSVGGSAVGIALIAVNQKLTLFVGAQEFDLLSSGVSASRKTIAPFVKRFVVTVDGAVRCCYTYLWVDVLDDPLNGTRDILKFSTELSKSPLQRLRFYHVWQALQRGENVTTEQAKAAIERAVAAGRAV